MVSVIWLRKIVSFAQTFYSKYLEDIIILFKQKAIDGLFVDIKKAWKQTPPEDRIIYRGLIWLTGVSLVLSLLGGLLLGDVLGNASFLLAVLLFSLGFTWFVLIIIWRFFSYIGKSYVRLNNYLYKNFSVRIEIILAILGLLWYLVIFRG